MSPRIWLTDDYDGLTVDGVYDDSGSLIEANVREWHRRVGFSERFLDAAMPEYVTHGEDWVRVRAANGDVTYHVVEKRVSEHDGFIWIGEVND